MLHLLPFPLYGDQINSHYIPGLTLTCTSLTRFPPNERTTATGISNMFNQLGNAGGFLLGPLLVREPDSPNSTLASGNVVHQLRDDILTLMNTEALVCTILFLCVLLYFPPKPHSPPSMASTVRRLNIRDGFIHIFRYCTRSAINNA